MATIAKPAVASKPSAVKPSAAPVASKAPPAKPAAAAPKTTPTIAAGPIPASKANPAPAKLVRPGGPPAPPAAAPTAPSQQGGAGTEILKQLASLTALVAALQKDVQALQKRASNASPATAEPLTEDELLQRAEKAKGLVPAEDPRHAYHGASLTLRLMSIAPNGAISAREEGGTFQAFLLIPSDADTEYDAKNKAVCSGASARAAGKLACYYAPDENGKHGPQGMIHLSLAELASLWPED